MLVPIVLLSGLLLLPVLTRGSVKGMEFEVSQPKPQVGLPDLSTALKAFSATMNELALPDVASVLERRSQAVRLPWDVLSLPP